MKLPVACPADSGTVMRVELERCWADSDVVKGHSCHRDGDGRLGLCKEHEAKVLDA